MERREAKGITIDASHTRDIDDALWVKPVVEGFQISISIADASSQVPVGSEIDEHAKEMAATRYFAAGNSPMLPRHLSEEGLSLLPCRLRQAVTVEVLLKPDMEATLVDIYLSDFRSAARVSYDAVSEIWSGTKAGAPESQVSNDLVDQIRTVAQLGYALLGKRRKAGALALYDLNTGWLTTEEGYLRQIDKKEDTLGQILVQEMMILANSLVAGFCVENEIPVLYRNHQARAAAPEREQLLEILNQGLHGPVAGLDLVRKQTHMLLEKAVYGSSLLGHYGLNLPAYLHFTSPIRRYADLVTHRQIKAFLCRKAYPYTKEEIEAIALHINETVRKEKEATIQRFKAKAEDKAQAAMDPRRIDALDAKSIERVVKVWARAEEGLDSGVESALRLRIDNNRLPLICFAVILFEAKKEKGWAGLQEACLWVLKKRPEDATSILSIASQTFGWEAPIFETDREGPDHAPIFRAAIKHIGREAGPCEAASIKEAKQRATLSLFHEICGFPSPSWTVLRDPGTKQENPIKVDWAKDPISALQEYSQAARLPPPEYAFQQTGPPHQPLISCTCRLGSVSKTAQAGKKQDAKRLAAHAVLSTVAE